MLRSLLIVAACVIPVGCRSQYGCNPFAASGTRVPPPATGSFGTPNTYYPNVGPRTSTAPAAAPRAINPSLGGWRTSNDDSGVGISSLSGDSAPTFASGTPIGSSLRAGQTSNVTSRAPTTKSAASQSLLKGMPINEAKGPVAPASFQSPVPTSDVNNDAGSSAGSVEASPKQPSSNPPSNALRNSSAALRSDAWQKRAAPAPNRIAGG